MASFYILVLDLNLGDPTGWIANESALDESTLLALGCFRPDANWYSSFKFGVTSRTATALPSCADPTSTPVAATILGLRHVA